MKQVKVNLFALKLMNYVLEYHNNLANTDDYVRDSGFINIQMVIELKDGYINDYFICMNPCIHNQEDIDNAQIAYNNLIRDIKTLGE